MASSRPTTRSVRDPLLDVAAAAAELGVTVRFVRRLIDERRIEYVKHGIGRRSPVRIRLSAIERYLDEHTVRPTR